MEFKLIKTDSEDLRFKSLVKMLDQELKITDGDEHDYYHQFNGINDINHVMIATQNDQAVACGAFKQFDSRSVEIKRMYTLNNYRRRGLALNILNALELWASENGFEKCILETGKRQVSAIKLYTKTGYRQIENYAQYKDMDNSVCFGKYI